MNSIYDRAFHDTVKIGDKVRIIPVHICPAVNLYDKAYLTSGDEVVGEYEVACRGKLQQRETQLSQQEIRYGSSCRFSSSVGWISMNFRS